MTNRQLTNWEEILDPDKDISKRQYRMIKAICSNELFIRAESEAHHVIGWDLLDLNQVEAHELIQYLNQYDTRDEETPFEELDRELGMALDRFDPQTALLNPETRLLCLLAMHRVATFGQITRFLFGLVGHPQSRDCKLAEPVLERALKAAIVARERGVSLRVAGRSVKTDVYYLMERGSDRLHQVAPGINYYARPGLPRRNRIYHDLCVLEARLDLQSHMNLENYEPEILILSEHQKVRNRSKVAAGEVRTTLPRESGCGDFRALVVDPITGNYRRAEVEVIIRSRAKELAAKPTRITDYYAGSLHRCFLIELWQHKLAKLVSNILAPLTEAEMADFAAPAAARKTVSETRLSKVRAALDRMGGVATPEAVALIAGIKATTASEALALLADQQEIAYCDGFPMAGKTMGRNLRLYTQKGLEIHSIYEFGRLLTASRFISSGIIATEFRQTLEPVAFDRTTGILLLDRAEKDWLLIAIIDDPSESPPIVVRWADSAYQQVSGMVDENRVIVVTADQGRAEEMSAIGRFKIVEVKTVTQSVSQEARQKGQTKNGRPGRRRHPQGHRRRG